MRQSACMGGGSQLPHSPGNHALCRAGGEPEGGVYSPGSSQRCLHPPIVPPPREPFQGRRFSGVWDFGSGFWVEQELASGRFPAGFQRASARQTHTLRWILGPELPRLPGYLTGQPPESETPSLLVTIRNRSHSSIHGPDSTGLPLVTLPRLTGYWGLGKAVS